MKKVISIYSIVIGVGIIGLWIMLLATDQVPELNTNPSEITLHITIETLMGFIAILAGVNLWKRWRYHKELFILSSGMIIYSVINSSGYYIDAGNLVMVFMFLFILLASLFSLYYIILRKTE